MSNTEKVLAVSKTPSVALIVPAYLPESYGGAVQQTRKLAVALTDRRLNVTIIAPRTSSSTPRTELKDGLDIRRIRVRSLPNLGGRHFLSFVWWSIRICWWLWRNRNSYDIIHIVHGRLHAVGAVLGARLTGKPVLIKFGRGGEHFDLDLVHKKRLFGRQFASIIKRHTTGFIANSAQMIADLERHNIEEARVHRIPNGVVIPEISGMHGNPAKSETVFLYMGRFDTEKALDFMLRSFKTAAASAPARLMLVGDGPLKPELEQLAQDIGISSRVTFTGVLEDVTPALKSADFYLSTSVSEGMSNSLLEAMSYGVVPVVSRVSGVDDMVSDGVSGFVFEPGNEEGCGNAIAKALTLPPPAHEEMSQAARQTLAARFSMESVAERHIELYQSLCRMRNRA